MKDFQIVIPTHGRARKQTTYESLPDAIKEDALIVTSTAEDRLDIINQYERSAKNTIQCPPSIKTISDKRQWIMENIKARKIFMLDDDMYFFGRCPRKQREYVDGRWKAKPGHKVLSRDYAPDGALVKMFGEIADALDEHAHVGLSSRMGNDQMEEEWPINTRMMHAIGYRRDIFLKNKVRFNEVRFREDFNVSLRLLRAGYRNTVCYSFCCSPGPYGAKGGTSTERTVDSSNREALKLAGLHPGLVRVVDKNYDNTPRKEVVVYWKKAFGFDSSVKELK